MGMAYEEENGIFEMNRETKLQREIHAAISTGSARLFRNSVGFDKTNRVQYGLCVGSSDLIGFHTRTITPDDVGKQIAVFVAMEVKTESGRVSLDQKRFIEFVKNAGGIAGVVRSVSDAINLLDEFGKS
jgi:hypothetical protein